MLSLRALRSRPARCQRNLRAQTRLLYSAWIAAKEQFLTAFLEEAKIRGRGSLFVSGLVCCQEKVLRFFPGGSEDTWGEGFCLYSAQCVAKKKFFASFFQERRERKRRGRQPLLSFSLPSSLTPPAFSCRPRSPDTTGSYARSCTGTSAASRSLPARAPGER